MVDILNRIFALRQSGESEQAFTLYGRILPHIVFSLQNVELYLSWRSTFCSCEESCPTPVVEVPASPRTPQHETTLRN
jgi:hypothetical protein